MALVYRAELSGLGMEEINEENSMLLELPSPLCFSLVCRLIFPLGKTNSFEVQLPRWRNQMDVYIDMEERKGYIASIRLGRRLGVKGNWQRHLGMNYQVLFVKGKKSVYPY